MFAERINNMQVAADVVILALLQVLTPTLGYECKCGKPADTLVSTRIVSRDEVTPHSHPWAVAIQMMSDRKCGGTIITNKHILSAGHCFLYRDARIDVEVFTVLIGLHDMSQLDDVTQRNITEVVMHEQFETIVSGKNKNDINDIAIATLNEPVVFGDTILPICLPSQGQDFSGRVGTIVGWGRMGSKLDFSNVLLKATLNILSYEECMRTGLADDLKPMMMCAFAEGKDACQSDSGGPLEVLESNGRYVQAGIISWGRGCAHPFYPGVYTNVSLFVEWIHSHTRTQDAVTCD